MNMEWKEYLWSEWEVVEEIGAGSYGKVYKIKRQDICGTYYAALKVISFPQNDRQNEILKKANFNKEQMTEHYYQLANELSREFSVMEKFKGNTNIVSYEDHKLVPQKDGIGWYVLIRMEMLTPLIEYIKAHEMSEREICKLGIDICNALILCQKENIIHRDIKPGNIFVSNYGDFKLGDFSIAQNVRLQMYTEAPMGTYTYMAPEVYQGKGYNFTIDLYALGLIIYRLFNRGRGPFLPLPPEKINLEIDNEANKLRLTGHELNSPIDASESMVKIIIKTCAYDCKQRYQTPDELKKSLENHLSDDNAKESIEQKVLKDKKEERKKKMSTYFMKAGDL